MPLAAGTRLGPYEILAPLGAGGMGEVYRARDMKLDRDVAIKVLPESVASSPEALRRFEREAKAVAALSHPNILAIHDFGTHDGISYAVMELLEGETLRDKIHARSISQTQAIDYGLQIIRGLAAAHEKGVVHRDLKPENVFVTRDGHLKILDFGLAKRVERIAGPADETDMPTVSAQTEPGTVLGTVGYMSPEQVRGLPVDHRTDIFSFGAILYELLSGRRAFSRPTPADTLSAILKEEPERLSGSGRGVPPALDMLVRHCLEKARDNRFQSARDVAFALSEPFRAPAITGVQAAAVRPGRWKVAVLAAVLLGLAAAALLLTRRDREAPAVPEAMQRIAVLPFENLGAPEDDYFADGISDAVRGKLTALPGVEVIARGSSMPYKKTTKIQNQISQELDARYLLTATVRWQKNGKTSRVQVTPELVEVRGSGAPTSRWQESFDASLTDVFQVQADIASRAAQALGVALGAGDGERLTEKPTQDLAAYDAFLKGEEAWRGLAAAEPAGLRKALQHYEQAVALDPGFAQSWAQLSRVSSSLYFNSTPTPELKERSRQAAEKAVALAPESPEGYLALGDHQRMVQRDFTAALESYARGLRLAPTSADLLSASGGANIGLGRWEAAVDRLEQAERVDPRSIPINVRHANALLRLRRYPETLEVVDRGLALAPGSLGLITRKVKVFLGQGDLVGARAMLKGLPKEVEPTALVAYLATFFDLVWVLDEPQRELLVRLRPNAFDDDQAIWGLCLAQAYALKGDEANVRIHAEAARKALEEQLRALPDDAQRHISLGLALAYLGRKEEAIREGERSVALRPVAKDADLGAYVQHQLARIYMLVGEPEKALDQLEPLLKIPYFLSPGWLEIDPNFDPLRKNPRFQRLVAGA